MLWLALYLPQLLLDDAARGLDPPPPLALLVERRLVAINPAAREIGLRAGLTQAEALSIYPGLLRIARDASREAELLQQLAEWALQYSSVVCPEPPAQLLLEIGGSRRLFGEPDLLRQRVLIELSELGYSARAGIAPTPTAAALFARARSEQIVEQTAELRAAIAPLPLSRLLIDNPSLARLHGAGLRRIGQLLDLPPAALARRCGPALGSQLLRLLGQLPDPRQGIRLPARFEQRLELPVTVGESSALQFPLRRLLRGLCGFLAARDAGISQCALRLRHHEPPDTEITLRLRDASADFTRLEKLASERLAATRLRAPVRELCLIADQLGDIPRDAADLLDGERGRSNLPTALERIAARLGETAVYQLAPLADHRPECAQRRLPQTRHSAAPPLGPRPLWLLDAPRPLAERLTIESGPERIESGWWPQPAGTKPVTASVRRDYYIARDRGGARYWVFETLDAPGCWFVHGIFA